MANVMKWSTELKDLLAKHTAHVGNLYDARFFLVTDPCVKEVTPSNMVANIVGLNTIDDDVLRRIGELHILLDENLVSKCCSHSLVVDIGHSKLTKGPGASRPFSTVILCKP